MLPRLVIAFLLRSKRLLISWRQLPSAMILEPKKIKSVTVSIASPAIEITLVFSREKVELGAYSYYKLQTWSGKTNSRLTYRSIENQKVATTTPDQEIATAAGHSILLCRSRQLTEKQPDVWPKAVQLPALAWKGLSLPSTLQILCEFLSLVASNQNSSDETCWEMKFPIFCSCEGRNC